MGLTKGVAGRAGMHAEQFRIWEALEVGALPVVLDEEQHSHLEQIGLRLPKVSVSVLPLGLLLCLTGLPSVSAPPLQCQSYMRE